MASKHIIYARTHSNDLIQRSYPAAVTDTVADWAGLSTAIESWMVTGTTRGGGFYDEETADNGNAASSPAAQKDLSAIMEIRDTVTGRTNIRRIPMPNLSKADDVGTNAAFAVSNGVTVFNTAHADYATLKAEVEAHLVSDEGNAVTLERVYIEE